MYKIKKLSTIHLRVKFNQRLFDFLTNEDYNVRIKHLHVLHHNAHDL